MGDNIFLHSPYAEIITSIWDSHDVLLSLIFTKLLILCTGVFSMLLDGKWVFLKFVGWVEKCITAAMFLVKVNGSLEGYFQGRSGLRQGDPLSPYLSLLAWSFFQLV